MGMISMQRLILFYTIQQDIPNVCTKFQNPRFRSSWKIFDEKKSLHTNTQTLLCVTGSIFPFFLEINKTIRKYIQSGQDNDT